jgi:hypothetical protein
MPGTAADDSMGTIVADAWVTAHRAQMFLAVWMMIVAGVEGHVDEGAMTVAGASGHCDDHGSDGRPLDIHPIAPIAVAMMLGTIFGHVLTRSPSTPSATAGATARVSDAAQSGASASASAGTPACVPEAASPPTAPPPRARQRAKHVFHTDSRSTVVHIDSQCQQLRNRSNQLTTRSVCSVCSGGLCLD